MRKDVKTLLRKRAAELAKEPVVDKKGTAITEVVEITMGPENYGIESVFVKEIYALSTFTVLPGVPSFITGVINVRGNIIAVVDLKKFFNLPETGLGEFNKVIIIADDQMEFGVLADSVRGVKMLYEEEMLPAPQSDTGIGKNYLRGVTKERLIILDVYKLLRDSRLIVNDEYLK